MQEQTPEEKKRRELEQQYHELRDTVEESPSGFNFARLGEICLELHRSQEAVGYFNRALAADPNGAQYLARKLQGQLSPDEYKQLVVPAPIVPITEALPDIITYPFRGKGLGIIIVGSIFFTLFRYIIFIIQAGIFWFMALIFVVFLMGYLLTYYSSIMKKTAFLGEDEPPNWPDITHMMAEIWRPTFWLLVTIIMGFIPTIVALLICWRVGAGKTTVIILSIVCSIAGIIVWPMMLMVVYVFNHLGAALDPRFILRSISAMGVTYLIGAIIFYVFCAVSIVLSYFENYMLVEVGMLIYVPIAPFMWFVRLYVFMAAFRLLGLMYREKAHKLKWFQD